LATIANKRIRKQKDSTESVRRWEPDLGEIDLMRKRLKLEPGFEAVADVRGKDAFREALRGKAESSLYLFSKLIMENYDLTVNLHKPIARFVTDSSFGKAKLVMLPMGHLKTSLMTKSQPLHFLIQPEVGNIYIPGLAGCNSRLLIAGETEKKSKQLLDEIKQKLMTSVWIAWLWPHVCWDNPKTDARRWTDTMIEVPRTRIFSEPTILAVGTETAVIQMHFDAIWFDDICGEKHQNSEVEMGNLDGWRKSMVTRGHIPTDHWEYGIGTHWTNADIYVDWKKELPPENVMVMSAIEDGQPIWPERYTVERLNTIRQRIGDVNFALWYMNKPVSPGFSALDWSELRQFRVTNDEYGRAVLFADSAADDLLVRRADGYTALQNLKRGEPLGLAYPNRARRPTGQGTDSWSPEFLDFMKQKYPEKVIAAADQERRRNAGNPYRGR
jgi:hypothetical protein